MTHVSNLNIVKVADCSVDIKIVNFHISPQNICCEYLLEASHGDASNEYSRQMGVFFAEKENTYYHFLLKMALKPLKCILNVFCTKLIICMKFMKKMLKYMAYMPKVLRA